MPEIYHDRGAALVATSMSAHARTGAWIASPKLQGWATGTTERPMTSASTCIGSHVAKARLDWLCRPHSQTVSVTNDTTGSAALVAHLHTLSPARIVLEVTGPYQMAVVAALVTAHVPWGHDRHRHVWDGAKATGHRATTDTNDAEVLAHVAAAMRPDPRPVPTPSPRTLRSTSPVS